MANSDDWWLNMEISAERKLALEIARRRAVGLSLHELQAMYDTLLVLLAHQEHYLSQAMRKVSELEIQVACGVETRYRQWDREHQVGGGG